MASKASIMDKNANVAAVAVAEAAAGTLASVKFNFPFSIMDKMALTINRIEYFFNTPGYLNSSGDYCIIGMCVASTLADANAQNDPLLVDSAVFERIDMGTAASGLFMSRPLVKDLSQIPGQGLMVAPAPLYAFIKSNGASNPCTGWVRMYYTYQELAADDYWQLVESRRIISNT